MTSTTSMRRLLASCIAILASLCVAGEAGAIANELLNGVAERVYRDYEDPDVAMVSYAMPRVTGALTCSGTMIGPSLLLTAAHCGLQPGGVMTATFEPFESQTQLATETFTCTYIANAMPDMDVMLLHCPPKSRGEKPGDKYGYVDFDVVRTPDGRFDYPASRAKVTSHRAQGDTIYSIWHNPITSLGLLSRTLYSEGQIADDQLGDNEGCWFCPNWPPPWGPDDYMCSNAGMPRMALGVNSNLWGIAGSSGSTSLSLTHRILLGPMSTARNDIPGRNQIAIADALLYARTFPEVGTPGCRDSYLPAINEPYLAGLGLPNPERYYGYMDDNLDGLFDLQQELEFVLGEGRRDWYWLGFESALRNDAWWRDESSSFNTEWGLAIIDTRDRTSMGVLRHERLDLEPNQVYRVGFDATMSESSSSVPLELCLRSTGIRGTVEECEPFDPPSGGLARYVVRFQTQERAHMLEFRVQPGTWLGLARLTIARDPSVMDFDSHAERIGWRNGNQPWRRAWIWPNGQTTTADGKAADWAGVVRRDPERPLDDDWSLESDVLALDSVYQLRVCFSHRNSPTDTPTGSDTMNGVVRLVDERGDVVGDHLVPEAITEFTPGSDWARTCTEPVWLPSHGTTLQFGVMASGSSVEGSYLVDDIELELTPPQSSCGLGAEVALLMPLGMWLYRRKQRANL